jgi:hypothetical protein
LSDSRSQISPGTLFVRPAQQIPIPFDSAISGGSLVKDKYFFIFSLFLLFGPGQDYSFADEVHFTNGDFLKGILNHESASTIVFESENLGVLTLSKGGSYASENKRMNTQAYYGLLRHAWSLGEAKKWYQLS